MSWPFSLKTVLANVQRAEFRIILTTFQANGPIGLHFATCISYHEMTFFHLLYVQHTIFELDRTLERDVKKSHK